MSVPSTFRSNERMPPKKPIAGPGSRQMGLGASPLAAGADSLQGTMKCDVSYRVDELLKGGREAILVHRGQEYRLRITSAGKLILTK